MVGVLAEVAAVAVHRPEVHRAVAVAGEVDPAVPEHRLLAGAGVIGRQRRGFAVTRRISR